MKNSLTELLEAFGNASLEDRSEFALRRAAECMHAVAAVHGATWAPATRDGQEEIQRRHQNWQGSLLRISTDSEHGLSCALLGQEVRNGDILEIQSESRERWSQIWIEGLPERVLGCWLWTAEVVRVPLNDRMYLRWPTHPNPTLRHFVQGRFEIGNLRSHGLPLSIHGDLALANE